MSNGRIKELAYLKFHLAESAREVLIIPPRKLHVMKNVWKTFLMKLFLQKISVRTSFTLFFLSLVVCPLNSGKQFSIYLLVDHRIDLGQMLLTPLTA